MRISLKQGGQKIMRANVLYDNGHRERSGRKIDIAGVHIYTYRLAAHSK